MGRLKRDAGGGHLVVGEFSRAPVPNYIWGSPVWRVFETMRARFSPSTALTVRSVDEAYAANCRTNGEPDENAARLTYMVFIQRVGEVADGRPQESFALSVARAG